MCWGVQTHVCEVPCSGRWRWRWEEEWAASCEPVFSVPLESENSKVKLGLPDHHEGIFVKAGGWDIFYLTVY